MRKHLDSPNCANTPTLSLVDKTQLGSIPPAHFSNWQSSVSKTFDKDGEYFTSFSIVLVWIGMKRWYRYRKQVDDWSLRDLKNWEIKSFIECEFHFFQQILPGYQPHDIWGQEFYPKFAGYGDFPKKITIPELF